MSRLSRGFTLIELLITISIIGVLATISIVQFTGAQRGSRDTRRQSDLKQYQTALEIYADQNNGLFPITDGDASALCGAFLSNTACPDDPQVAAMVPNYQYSANDTGSLYVLWGVQEKTAEFFVLCSSGAVGTIADTWGGTVDGVCPI